jgi:hypothetical protein
MGPAPLRRGLGWLPLPLAGALAVWLYRPWQSRAFDVLDFSEFLPLLNAAHGFPARLASLTDYYAGVHGRFNLLSYAALAAKWSWLGDHPLLWQLLRAAELLLIAAAAFMLLRRLSAGVFGAALGATLLLFSYSAALPWVRLTMGEPLGLCCALAAALLATPLDEAEPRSSTAVALAAGLLLAAAVLAKEMLVLWVPAVLLIAVTRVSEGRLTLRRRDPVARRFGLSLLAGGLLASLAVLYVARKTSVAGYAATYGEASATLTRFGEILQRQFLPWPITGRSDGTVMLLAALLFIGVILAGMRAGLRDPARRGSSVRALWLGLSLPVLGTLVYLPWPVYSPFYGYPFVFGSGVLLATALTNLRVLGGRAERWGGAAAVAALLLGVPHAVHLARAAAAQQEVMTAVARVLPEARGAQRIVAAVAALPAQAWQGTAPSLARYAVATTPGLVLPPAQDLRCGDAGKLLTDGVSGVVLLSFSTNCGAIQGAELVIRSDYSYWQWEPPGFRRDSVRADVVVRR